jgi:hypothetical protein
MVDHRRDGVASSHSGPHVRWPSSGPSSPATANLARSAAALGATLTPDDVAISRANAAVVRLDVMVEQMRRSGQLQEFNSRYKRGRAAALAEGRGFMGYAPA